MGVEIRSKEEMGDDHDHDHPFVSRGIEVIEN